MGVYWRKTGYDPILLLHVHTLFWANRFWTFLKTSFRLRDSVFSCFASKQPIVGLLLLSVCMLERPSVQTPRARPLIWGNNTKIGFLLEWNSFWARRLLPNYYLEPVKKFEFLKTIENLKLFFLIMIFNRFYTHNFLSYVGNKGSKIISMILKIDSRAN